MSFAVTVQDTQELRRLIPLNILSASRFKTLCAELSIEELPKGGVLFNEGDTKNEFVYVLSGTVSLQAGGMEMETISGGTESARFALAHQLPRKVSAVAKERVRFIRVDTAYINQPSEIQNNQPVSTYEVSEVQEDADDDWVTTLLKSPIFQRLPAANLQNILSNLEEIQVNAGQEIIHQDEPGDYYYIIKQGRCALSRKPSRLAREIKLAELKTCDTFGEDSLISDEPRNVTVTMLTDGILLRLSKANFIKLVKEPVIAFVDLNTAHGMVQENSVVLDVRSPDVFEEGHLLGAVNVPFFKLRVELPGLNRLYKFILVCENGRVSEAAAFLLIRNNFMAYVLKDGIASIPPEQLVGGTERGGASEGAPQEIIEEPAPHEQAEEETVDPATESKADGDRLLLLDQLRQTQLRLDTLGKENQTLKKEFTLARNALTELQASAKKNRAEADGLRQQLSLANGEASEARARLEMLNQQIDELKREPPLPETSPNDQDLARKLAAAEASCQTLETDLKLAIADKIRLGRELSELREAATASQPSEELQALTERVRVLEAELDSAADAERAAAGQAATLEKQVAELSAVVKEFVEQQSHGEADDEVESLRAELEMVRKQATGDVIAMQTQLRGADQEIARIKNKLETAQAELLNRDAGIARSVPRKDAQRRKPLASVFQALLYIALGAAMLAVIAAGTNGGREWTRDIVSRNAQP